MADEVVDLVTQDTERLKRFEFRPVVLATDFWVAYSNAELHWQRVQFERRRSTEIPDRAGVYSFVIHHETSGHTGCRYLAYVGKAQDSTLRRRFRDYFYEAKSPTGRPKIKRMVALWKDYLWFYYAESRKAEVATLENALLVAMQPPMNDEYPAGIAKARKAAF